MHSSQYTHTQEWSLPLRLRSFEELNNGHFRKGTRRSRAKNQWATPVFDFLLTDAPNFERMGAGYLLHSTMAEIRSMKLP